MNLCRNAREQMQEALDGLLDGGARQSLMDHIAGCVECDNAWRALCAADGTLARAPMIEAPAGFARRLRARIEVERMTRQNPWGWVLLGGLTVAVALLSGLASLSLLSDASGWISPGAWVSYGLIAVEQVFATVMAVAHGAWLLLRGLYVYTGASTALLCAAAAGMLVAGLTLVARTVQQGVSARS